MQWERIIFLICRRFINSVLCMLMFLMTFRRPVTKLFAHVARKFMFYAVSSSFLIFTGIHFRRIQLYLFIFMCKESVSSAVAILSAPNSISQSFSMNNFTVCLLVGIVSNPSNCRVPYQVWTKYVQRKYVQTSYFRCSSVIRREDRQTDFAA